MKTNSRTSNRLFRRLLVRTLVEVVPPIAITSFGRGMVLAGHALENFGRTLQTTGTVVEAFGEDQMRRSGAWFDAPVASPAPVRDTPLHS